MTTAPRLQPRILVVLGFVILGLVLVHVRPLDGDEGYYASAARLVAEGGTPYADFFYPQAPLLPYVYAPWQMLTGSSFSGLRILSVLSAALGLWFLGSYFSRRPGRPVLMIVLGVMLVAADPHFLTWNVVVKTFALTNLGVLAVLWLLHRGWTGGSGRHLVLAGVIAGLVVGVRLMYVAWAGSLWLGVLIIQWRESGTTGIRQRLGPLTAGLAAGLLPMLLFFVRDPDRFLFNNLRYHVLRYSVHRAGGAGWDVRFWDALMVLGRTLVENPYLLVLLVLAVWGLYSQRRETSSGATFLRIWAGGVLAQVLVSLLPDPVYEQYFTAAWSPLFAPLSLVGLEDLLGRVRRPAVVAGAGMAGLVVYAAVMLGVFHTGMDMNPVWSLTQQRQVARAIQARSQPGDMVLAFWSGYPFVSQREWTPGMENHFALGISPQLTLRQRRRYRVAGKDLLAELFRARTPQVVVLGAWMYEVNTQLDQQDLVDLLDDLKRNYRLDTQVGEAEIMVRMDRSGR